MEKLDLQEIKSKTIGSLLGVCIGDAMGLPLECAAPALIRKHHGYVDTYVTNKYHPFKNVSKKPKATWSDDTQLTLALMDSLSRTDSYSLQDIRLAHVEAYDGKWGELVGWGGTTRKACQRMKDGDVYTAVENGAGNGTPMKIAPLAIYYVYRCAKKVGRFTNSINASLFKKCSEVALLTHGDLRCAVAAYCQARMIIRAMQDEIPEYSHRIAELFIKDAEYAESKITWPEETVLLSDRMAPYILDRDKYEVETSAISVDICVAQSSFIMNSYPLVAYCTCKYLPYANFQYALTQTVNAGADADSNGSMVGAIAGAYLGYDSIPKDWIRKLRKANLLAREIRKFEKSI